MLPDKTITNATVECEIVSQRVFDYPRAKVFEAWKTPEYLQSWWGPKGFTNTFIEFNFSEGGRWKFVMHGPNGANYENECTFIKIEEPSFIVMNHVVAPLFQVQAGFEELGPQTKLSFKMIFLSADLCEQLRPICIPSNEENFDRLLEVLQKM